MSAAPVTRVAGQALPLRGHNLDTDRIVPARFVKDVPWDRLGPYVFADDRAHAAQAGELHVFDDPRYAGATVMLVEENFGCGSSREHAVAALAGWRSGVTAIVGRSFSNIFQANALANGIPCAVVDPVSIGFLFETVEAAATTRVIVDVERAVVEIPERNWSSPAGFAPGAAQRFLAGTWDPLDQLLANLAHVADVASSLPYQRWIPRIATR